MIHIVIGGSLSGKTTFVRKRFMEDWTRGGWQETRTATGVPATVSQNTVIVGHYLKPIRTCGVDQMGRNYREIHKKILALIRSEVWTENELVMEGNALYDHRFMDALDGLSVKLYMMNPPPVEIGRRYKALNCRYGRSIIVMSHKRAWKIWNAYREVFAHEISTG